MKFDVAINVDDKVQMWEKVGFLHCITLILLLKWKQAKQVSITLTTTQDGESNS